MSQPTSAEFAAAPTAPPLAFDRGFRLSLVLDPAGTVRHVATVHGIATPPAEVFIGASLSEISARREGGPERGRLWEQRLALARETDVAAHYADPPPGAPADARAVVETTVTPIRSASGDLQAIYVDIQDLTTVLDTQDDLIQSEARSREQEEQLRAALAMTGLGRFVIDLIEPSMSGDERFWEIMGFDVAPFEPSTEAIEWFAAQVDPRDQHRRLRAFERAVAGLDDYDIEYRFPRPTDDGSEERWVAVVGRVEFGDGGPARMVGVVDDITDRRRGEELRLVTQKREAIGTLAGGVAHDFNNVISAILSNATVARREVESGASPLTSITEIARGAVRAADLVRRMLAYSREDEPTRSEVSLGDIAREACALLRPTLPAGVELRVETSAAHPTVVGDASQLHQVVVNLVTNAGQAINGRGTVEVSIGSHVASPVDDEAGEHVAAIRVRDDGSGMTEAVRRRVFDPFFTTKPDGEGTGLGLAAARTIIRAHGGTIEVDSDVGRGTTFTCLLPAGDPASADGAQAPRSEQPADRCPRVLFVDDEPSLARLAERALPMSGCDAQVFLDPYEALQAFAAAPDSYDALVTDLSMPGLSGLELIDQVRRIRADLPVVLTSGFLSDQERREAEARGVDAILPKPCSIGDLADTVIGLVGSA